MRDRLHRHAHARSYRAAINDAHSIVRDALTVFGEPAAVGLSGGKDSVAMCHIVAEHCRPVIIWNDSGLELPESEGIVLTLAARLGLDVVVARGVDAFERSIEIAAETSSNREGRLQRLDEHAIMHPVRDALVRVGAKVEFVGLRSAESRRRKIVIAKHGPICKSKRFGCGIAWPMRRWSAADVFAYIDDHGLPLHPAYSRTGWAERDEIRVSWLWDISRESKGDLEYLRRYYPDVYQRVRTAGLVECT
jgi:phosphoadenosine phosphosulfate reductase